MSISVEDSASEYQFNTNLVVSKVAEKISSLLQFTSENLLSSLPTDLDSLMHLTSNPSTTATPDSTEAPVQLSNSIKTWSTSINQPLRFAAQSIQSIYTHWRKVNYITQSDPTFITPSSPSIDNNTLLFQLCPQFLLNFTIIPSLDSSKPLSIEAQLLVDRSITTDAFTASYQDIYTLAETHTPRLLESLKAAIIQADNVIVTPRPSPLTGNPYKSTKEDINLSNEEDSEYSLIEPSTTDAIINILQSTSKSPNFNPNPAVATINPTSPSSPSSSTSSSTANDPVLETKARKLGLRLSAFKDKGLEEETYQSFNKMIENTSKSGLLSYLQNISNTETIEITTTADTNGGSMVNKGEVSHMKLTSTLDMLLEEGQSVSSSRLTTASQPSVTPDSSSTTTAGTPDIPFIYDPSDLSNLALSTPTSPTTTTDNTTLPSQPLTKSYIIDEKKLELLIQELSQALPERHDLILSSYKDLYLSPNFLLLLQNKNKDIYLTNNVRLLYSKITYKGIEYISQLTDLIKQESIQHLQTIYDICQISSKFQHNEIQFLNEIELIKNKFDTTLLSYIKYAIQEEEYSILSKLKRENTLANKVYDKNDVYNNPSRWLQILNIIYNGVYYELSSRFQRLLDPLLLILRFEQRDVQSYLYQRLVESTAVIDLPYLKSLSQNIVDYYEVNGGVDGHNSESSLPTPSPLPPSSSSSATATRTSGTASSSSSSSSALLKDGDTGLNPPVPTGLTASQLAQLTADLHTYLSDEIIQDKLITYRKDIQPQGVQIDFKKRNIYASEAEERQYQQEQVARIVSPSILDNKGKKAAEDEK